MNTTLSNDIPSSRSASTQSIFSRIAAPFSGKSRSFADFDIHLDEPLREYRAGDVVKGSIQLAVPKPLRITHLVLSLRGFAKVYKNAAAPGEGLPSEFKIPTSGRGKSGSEYLGNGLVSLFEDEMILCGAGKLNLGKYSFRFEAHFPSKSLPSSLSFERGTISYVLVATLTRPTTIVPTISREMMILFRETLDVALVPRPKTRKLHLKTVKRSRKRTQPKRSLTDRTINSNTNTNQSSTDSSELPPDDRTQDCNASEASHETGNNSLILHTVHTPSRGTLNLELPMSPDQDSVGMPSASVDVLKGGFLPGDLIPIRILVKHNKPIKSMQGIIVTLYRQAKIDSSPIVGGSRGPTFGLTLSGSGSHKYRMDLAQAFAPMIINPLTLEADIKIAVKVPDDCFPTVKSVPGHMIIFTYHVEVIMDLGAKLSNQERMFSSMNMTSKAPNYTIGAQPSGSEYGLPSSMEMYHLIDTSEIKREKRVPQETIEVLIGSHDSRRKGGDIKKVDLWLQDDLASNFSNAEESPLERQLLDTPRSPEYEAMSPNGPALWNTASPHPPQLLLSEFQEPTDEKSRIRLAEQRLLPSAPPDSEDFASSSRTVPFAVPSAPPISDLDTYHPANHVTGAPDFEVLGLQEDDEIAPAYKQETNDSVGTMSNGPLILPESSHQTASEDKAELERRRLLAMASSPDDQGEDDPGASSSAAHVPTAPLLDENDLTLYETQELEHALPVYAPRV